MCPQAEPLHERAFKELDALEERLKELEATGLDDPELFRRWELLHATFERRGGYARRARRDAVLSALGFAERHDQPVRQLSGGERTRLGLAQLLMAQPDVLLLDEPTNHLDIEMRGWLEGHLSRYPGAALIVSHDRAFLDGAASRTAEVSRGKLRHGPGNPTTYRTARAESERLQAMQHADQVKERERLQDATDQMKKWAGQNAKLHRRAKAMQKRVDRFEAEMVDEVERGERVTRFTFDADESGSIVLTGDNLTKSFGQRTLFEDVTFELRQGDRVGLVGRNGMGKSTLLKMDFGHRFPVLDTDFRDAVRARVQQALETGDVTPPFGHTALLLAAAHVNAQVFPGVDTAAMDAVVAGDTAVSGAGFHDAATIVVLQQMSAAVQHTTLR